MWERMHGWIPLPCKNAHTNSFHGPPVNTHAGKESVQSLLWKYPLILSFSHKHSPHLLYSPLTHTHSSYTTSTFFGATFLFSQTGLPSVRPKSLSSLHLSWSVCASRCLCHLLLLPLHPKIPLRSVTPPNNPSSPLPLCLNSFGPREQTKKGLCPGRKRWCVTQRGDNASAGSTPSQAPSLSLFVSLISYHQFTFTEAQHTSASNISLLHQHTG